MGFAPFFAYGFKSKSYIVMHDNYFHSMGPLSRDEPLF